MGMFWKAVKIVLMILSIISVQTMLVSTLYDERGYFAFGGEWLFLLLVIAGVIAIATAKPKKRVRG